MKEIKIGVLNEKNCQEKWVDFSSFMNLNSLYLESLQTQGIFQKSENEIKARKIEFPPNLISLAIGSYFSPRILLNLPLKIENLKLIGDQFRNRDLFDVLFSQTQVYLPNLKVLDISESPYLNPECLQSFSHIKVYTNWERDKAQYANNFYRPQSI